MRKIHTWPAALLLLAAQSSPAAVVTQYTYSTTCKPNPAYSLWGDCSTLEHLYERARTWVNTAPKPLAGSTPETPSIVLVTSTTIPISAIFRFYRPPRTCTTHGCFTRPPIVSYFQPARTGNLEVDTYAAAKLDRQVTATRALKIHPVDMPDSLGRANATSAVGVVNALNDIFDRQSAGTSALWGLFGYHMPNTRYIDVIDDRSGEQHRIFVGDTLTVVFADKSSLAVELKQSATTYALVFAVVAGSARNPAGQPYTLIAKPAKPGNGAQWVIATSVVNGRLIGPGLSCQFPGGQVCVNDGAMVRCANTRAFIGPC